eukprot:6690589-Karenia_brevis.AAC.1
MVGLQGVLRVDDITQNGDLKWARGDFHEIACLGQDHGLELAKPVAVPAMVCSHGCRPPGDNALPISPG